MPLPRRCRQGLTPGHARGGPEPRVKRATAVGLTPGHGSRSPFRGRHRRRIGCMLKKPAPLEFPLEFSLPAFAKPVLQAGFALSGTLSEVADAGDFAARD